MYMRHHRRRGGVDAWVMTASLPRQELVSIRHAMPTYYETATVSRAVAIRQCLREGSTMLLQAAGRLLLRVGTSARACAAQQGRGHRRSKPVYTERRAPRLETDAVPVPQTN